MITGCFKYFCEKHRIQVKNVFNRYDQMELHRKLIFKKKLLLAASSDVKEIIDVGVCCILQKDLFQLKTRPGFYDDKLEQNIVEKLSNFDPEKYKKLNYQDAILPAFMLYLEDIKLSDQSKTISQFDVSFAYIRAISHPDYKIPCGNYRDYFFNDAEEMFKLIQSENRDCFGFIKFSIVFPENFLPFIPFCCMVPAMVFEDDGICSSGRQPDPQREGNFTYP